MVDLDNLSQELRDEISRIADMMLSVYNGTDFEWIRQQAAGLELPQGNPWRGMTPEQVDAFYIKYSVAIEGVKEQIDDFIGAKAYEAVKNTGSHNG